jgi:hypothetical protein
MAHAGRGTELAPVHISTGNCWEDPGTLSLYQPECAVLSVLMLSYNTSPQVALQLCDTVQHLQRHHNQALHGAPC